jgi:hypothetical protein
LPIIPRTNCAANTGSSNLKRFTAHGISMSMISFRQITDSGSSDLHPSLASASISPARDGSAVAGIQPHRHLTALPRRESARQRRRVLAPPVVPPSRL